MTGRVQMNAVRTIIHGMQSDRNLTPSDSGAGAHWSGQATVSSFSSGRYLPTYLPTLPMDGSCRPILSHSKVPRNCGPWSVVALTPHRLIASLPHLSIFICYDRFKPGLPPVPSGETLRPVLPRRLGWKVLVGKIRGKALPGRPCRALQSHRMSP